MLQLFYYATHSITVNWCDTWKRGLIAAGAGRRESRRSGKTQRPIGAREHGLGPSTRRYDGREARHTFAEPLTRAEVTMYAQLVETGLKKVRDVADMIRASGVPETDTTSNRLRLASPSIGIVCVAC